MVVMIESAVAAAMARHSDVELVEIWRGQAVVDPIVAARVRGWVEAEVQRRYPSNPVPTRVGEGT